MSATLLRPNPNPFDLNAPAAVNAAAIAAAETLSVADADAGNYVIGCEYVISRSLTVAQLQNAFSVPILMAAPKAGAILVPIIATLRESMGAVVFSASPVLTARWVGGSGAILSAMSIQGAANQTRYTISSNSNAIVQGVDFNPTNKGIQFEGSLDRTGGSGTFVLMMQFRVIAGF